MQKPNLSDTAVFYLAEIRRWAKFLSILGFIMVGFMVLMGFMMGFLLDAASQLSSQSMPFPSSFLTVFYIIVAVVYFFPVYYLYKFSEDLKQALDLGKEEQLTSSLRWLKSHYKFIGILMIISIGLGILGFFASILAGFFGFFAASGL